VILPVLLVYFLGTLAISAQLVIWAMQDFTHGSQVKVGLTVLPPETADNRPWVISSIKDVPTNSNGDYVIRGGTSFVVVGAVYNARYVNIVLHPDSEAPYVILDSDLDVYLDPYRVEIGVATELLDVGRNVIRINVIGHNGEVLNREMVIYYYQDDVIPDVPNTGLFTVDGADSVIIFGGAGVAVMSCFGVWMSLFHHKKCRQGAIRRYRFGGR
jgi:hypothetical protein